MVESILVFIFRCWVKTQPTFLKAGGGKAGKREVLYDKIDKKYNKKQIWLSKDEYANLMHELNTNLTHEERKKRLLERTIGNYKYRIKNNGFNEYTIIGKKEIK